MSEKLRVLHVIVQPILVLDDGEELRPAPQQMAPVNVRLSELADVQSQIVAAVAAAQPAADQPGGLEPA